MTTTTVAEQRTAFYKSIGLEYSAVFIPTPQPKEKHPRLHWMVTLSTANGSARFPYFEGMGHVKHYKQSHKTDYDRRQAEACYRKTCETGYLYRPSISGDFPAWKIGTQPPPLLDDVLYCLVLDADVLDMPNFKEWASEFGYDTDSRKAETTYRQCLEQSVQLQRIIGAQHLATLRDLFDDY